jgi:hypothetical protein
LLASKVTLVAATRATPPHPENVDPLSGVALNSTVVFTVSRAWQLVPHSIPDGIERTVPMPVPTLAVVKVLGPPISVTVPSPALVT